MTLRDALLADVNGNGVRRSVWFGHGAIRVDGSGWFRNDFRGGWRHMPWLELHPWEVTAEDWEVCA